MAQSEACDLFIEQQIEEGLQDGKTPYSIGKDLAEWIEKLFEAKINPATLEKRAERKRDSFPTFVGKKSKPQASSQLIDPPRITSAGGKRKGSGRPKRELSLKEQLAQSCPSDPQEDVVSDEFKQAFEVMLTAIKNAKHLSWNTTSKEAILKHLEILFNVTTMGGPRDV